MPAQPTQEMFENLLAKEFWNKTIVNGEPSMESPESDNSHSPFTTHYSPIWLEDESQRIGNLNIPMSLWNTMRMSPLYFLEVPFEERLNCLVEEYGHCDVQKLMEATQRISKRLGGLETKNTLVFFEEGNIREAFNILLHYYDKRYLKGLHNREDISALLIKISCEKVSPLNSQALLNQYQNL
jgi:tRNA 2-selenouridine synthase